MSCLWCRIHSGRWPLGSLPIWYCSTLIITNTLTIRAVVANGRYFDRAALDQLIATAQVQMKQMKKNMN